VFLLTFFSHPLPHAINKPDLPTTRLAAQRGVARQLNPRLVAWRHCLARKHAAERVLEILLANHVLDVLALRVQSQVLVVSALRNTTSQIVALLRRCSLAILYVCEWRARGEEDEVAIWGAEDRLACWSGKVLQSAREHFWMRRWLPDLDHKKRRARERATMHFSSSWLPGGSTSSSGASVGFASVACALVGCASVGFAFLRGVASEGCLRLACIFISAPCLKIEMNAPQVQQSHWCVCVAVDLPHVCVCGGYCGVLCWVFCGGAASGLAIKSFEPLVWWT